MKESINLMFDRIIGKPETRHKDVQDQVKRLSKRLKTNREIGIGSVYSGEPMATKGAV